MVGVRRRSNTPGKVDWFLYPDVSTAFCNGRGVPVVTDGAPVRLLCSETDGGHVGTSRPGVTLPARDAAPETAT